MENIIKCPQCSKSINVSEILFQQIQEQLNKEYQSKSAQKDKELQEKLKLLQQEKDKLAKEKEDLQGEVEAAVKIKLTAEKTKLEKIIKDQMKEETSEQIKNLQGELTEKSQQIKELNQTKIEIEKLKREKDELKDQISLEKEKEFSEKLKVEKLKIKKLVDEENTFKIKELEKQLEDQKKLAEEMKRKADQGSMQLQGEVQELALEEQLKVLFPFDLIAPVSKGIRGADVIQTVRNKVGLNCGTILYESKRTKAFSSEWIQKLKVDAVAEKADISIIVTEALPEGIDRIGQIEGVWVFSFTDFKGLVMVLRDSVIRINESLTSQSNKGEKMEMLYNYLISNEFRLQMDAIVEGFRGLQESYVQEKRAMGRIWKEREKQLEKEFLNTNHFIGSVKGIAGSWMATK